MTQGIIPTTLKIDAPNLVGRGSQDIRAWFGEPLIAFGVRPGERASAPMGGKIERFQETWGLLEVVFAGGRATSLTFAFDRIAPVGADAALRILSLPDGQAPNVSNPWLRRWDNLAGNRVVFGLEPKHEYVTQATVSIPEPTTPAVPQR